jgi:hypothetical protein
MPVVALEARARSIIDLCLSFKLRSAGAEPKTWFQSLPSSVTITPRLAAACLTASTSFFGTDHFSQRVSGRILPVTLAIFCDGAEEAANARVRRPLGRRQ